jgi:enhancer of polycomb-like protein
VANYEELYPHGAYTDPHGYIRFSATVEETMGIAYTIDEEDEDWLEDYNIAAAQQAKAPSKSSSHLPANSDIDENKPPSVALNGIDSHNSTPNSPSSPASPSVNGHNTATRSDLTILAKNGHYPPLGPLSAHKAASRKRKQLHDTNEHPSQISEDDFELVMDLLERATDKKAPTLHSVCIL